MSRARRVPVLSFRQDMLFRCTRITSHQRWQATLRSYVAYRCEVSVRVSSSSSNQIRGCQGGPFLHCLMIWELGNVSHACHVFPTSSQYLGIIKLVEVHEKCHGRVWGSCSWVVGCGGLGARLRIERLNLSSLRLQQLRSPQLFNRFW